MKALMVRTDFSLGESALKAENAVKIARDAGYTAVISADSMNIASVIPLQRTDGDDEDDDKEKKNGYLFTTFFE